MNKLELNRNIDGFLIIYIYFFLFQVIMTNVQINTVLEDILLSVLTAIIEELTVNGNFSRKYVYFIFDSLIGILNK